MISDLWYRLYEGQLFRWLPALYKVNPCDVGARPWVKAFGLQLQRLAVECPCCAGARIVLAFLAGAALARWAPSALLAVTVGGLAAAAAAATLLVWTKRDGDEGV